MKFASSAATVVFVGLQMASTFAAAASSSSSSITCEYTNPKYALTEGRTFYIYSPLDSTLSTCNGPLVGPVSACGFFTAGTCGVDIENQQRFSNEFVLGTEPDGSAGLGSSTAMAECISHAIYVASGNTTAGVTCKVQGT